MSTQAIFDTQETLNHAAYNQLQVVSHYESEDELQEPEIAIFARIGKQIKGKRILDVGVGGGRTTHYLCRFSSQYVGVDYSEAMVRACQRRFPEVSFLHADARELTQLFEPGFFDCIVFSFNGLDCISPEGRLQVLKGFYQLLAPGGYLVFSAHNRDWNQLASVVRENRTPLRLARGLARYTKVRLKQLTNRKLETHTSQYAVVCDNEGILVYSISLQQQLQQLAECGFNEPLAIVDTAGNEVFSTQRETRSPWLYYLLQK